MRKPFRKKQREIVSITLLIIVLFLVWLNLEFSKTLGDNWNFIDCQFPCYGVTCKTCKLWTRKGGPHVDIAKFLNLNIQRSFVTNSTTRNTISNANIQICKRASFNLEHDSVKYAFFHLKALNCSGTKLFYDDFPAFRLNVSALKGHEIEKCSYYGINRLNDDFQTFSEPLVKEKGPFDLIFKQDFVLVKCYFRDNNSNVANKSENETKNSKDILQVKPLDSETDIKVRDEVNPKQVANDVKDINPKEKLKNKAYPTDTHTNISAKSDSKKSKIKVNNEMKKDHGNNADKNHDSKDIGKYHGRKGKEMKDVIRDNKEENKELDGVKHKQKHGKDKENSNKHNNTKEKLENEKSSFSRKLLQDDGNEKNQDIQEDLDNDQDSGKDVDYAHRDYYYDPFLMDLHEEPPDFEQLLVQVYPKSDIFQRIDDRTKHRRPQQYMNVLIIGLDSMSHLSFQRKFPLTYKYLKDKLKSVILDGYNIVGDATTAALIPILTGKFETELPEVRRNQFESYEVDVYPLIWKDFQKVGYVTMFAEDEPSIGVFNLRLNGFKNQPTDHYMRPFWQALWDSEIRKSSPQFCTGFKPNHEYLLDYLKDFYQKYSNVSKFAFMFGSELTHWDNNPGEYMDLDLTNLLKYFKTKKFLDDTLLIVMGDHGARYSRVRKTVQGKMEERLPMMALRFPDWFQQKFPKLIRNLQNNVDKLTTPFDIHETLKDVLDLQRTKLPVDHSKRAFSLLQRIPFNRTCSSSHIQMHWCTCLKQVDLNPHDEHVRKSAQSVVKFMNSRTVKVRDQCAKLMIKKILHAQLLIPNEMVLMFQNSQDDDQRVANFSKNINVDHAHFQITMETGPNNGLYEATVQVNMTSYVYTVIDDVSRLNLYGNQPKCIQDKYPDLRKYCYCLNFAPNEN